MDASKNYKSNELQSSLYVRGKLGSIKAKPTELHNYAYKLHFLKILLNSIFLKYC